MLKKVKTDQENKKLCGGCSLCCEYVTVALKKPKDKSDIDEILWYLLHGMVIFLEKGECRIYRKRPQLCREHSQDECERYDEEPFEAIIKNSREFFKYAKTHPELKKLITKN